MNIIAKIDIIYQNKCENISLEVLKHPLLEEEIGKEHIGNTASKHLVQNSSLLGHLQKLGTFEVSYLFHRGRSNVSHQFNFRYLVKVTKIEKIICPVCLLTLKNQLTEKCFFIGQ